MVIKTARIFNGIPKDLINELLYLGIGEDSEITPINQLSLDFDDKIYFGKLNGRIVVIVFEDSFIIPTNRIKTRIYENISLKQYSDWILYDLRLYNVLSEKETLDRLDWYEVKRMSVGKYKLCKFSSMKFTLDYLKNLFQHNIMWQDAKKNLDFLNSYSEKDPKAIEDFLSIMNSAYDKVVHLMGNIHFKEKDLLGRLLEWNDIPTTIHDFFPIPVYVSSSSSDEDSVGIMLFEDGKKELFEGNTEASDETYQIVNELLGVVDRYVKVYGQHGARIIRLIDRTQKIPKGIYVSPRRDVAEGYWSINEEKYLFSCEIQEKYVRKESDIDWKIIEDCKIRNFKIL